MSSVNFYTPKLIIRNISNKAVRILGLATIQPEEVFDLFVVTNPTELSEDTILRALEKPWGDLYREVVEKKTIVIEALNLVSFNYARPIPSTIFATNSPVAGQILSAKSEDVFEWIDNVSSVVAPLTISDGAVSIPKADATTSGYLSKEDFVLFYSGIGSSASIRIWQHQDFAPPVSNILSISGFENGTGLGFNSSYIVDGTATIVLVSDNETPPSITTSIPGRWLPSNRVSVSSHVGTSVVLSGTPSNSQSCRVYFLIDLPSGVSYPDDYVEAPQFIRKERAEFIDASYVNIEGNEAISGIKTFSDEITVTSGIRFSDNTLQTTSALGGTVTSVSVVTSNGVSGTVATATSTPAITLTLGAITPLSILASGSIAGSTLSGTNTGDISIATANGLSLAGQALSLAAASGSTTGALTSTDWTTFNTKEAVLTFSAPLSRNVNTISIPAASASADGYVNQLAQTFSGDKTFTGAITSSSGVGLNPIFGLVDGDVAHGLTTVVSTGTVGRFTTATTSTASRGGLLIEAFANSPGTGDATCLFWATEVTNSGTPYFVFRISGTSGTSRALPSQTANRIHSSWQVHSSAAILMRLCNSGQLGLNVAPAAGSAVLDVEPSTDGNSTGAQASADTSFRVARFAGTFKESNGGTAHPVMSTVEVAAPTITNGTAATTVASSLWVSGVPSGVTPTAGNYAAFIQGVSRIAVDGTAAAPALSFGATADNDTGIWHPTADTISFSTGGTEMLRISGAGLTFSDATIQATAAITRVIASVSTTTAAAAASKTDYVYFASGTITITLPTAVGNTNRYTIKNISSGVITVAFTGAQTGDGSTTLSLTANAAIDLVSDNANYWVI